MNRNGVVGPHGHDFDELARCLLGFSDEPVVFVPNPGNAGDNLINLGTYLLFERLGIFYELGSHQDVYPDRIVIHGGGGSLVSHYSGTDAFFRRNHPVCKTMILLPHTVRSHPDMIAGMDERCHLFVRERPSHDFVSRHATRAHLYLAHDMAFMLDEAYVAGLRWDWNDLARKGLLRSWLTMLTKFTMIAKLRDSTLHSMRTDSESIGQPNDPLNFDMSRMFTMSDMQFPACANAAKALQKTLQAFRRVETDRLHIAIYSALLGLDVEMRDNSYGKNRDIYAHSIMERFDNVRFVG